jgi:hypothetical protein
MKEQSGSAPRTTEMPRVAITLRSLVAVFIAAAGRGASAAPPDAPGAPTTASEQPLRCTEGWCRENPLFGNTHRVIRGRAKDDVWSLEPWTVHHFDGTSWSHTDLGIPWPLFATSLSPLGPSDAVVVGSRGWVARRAGASWRNELLGPYLVAWAVWGSRADDVWAVVQSNLNAIVHWDGVRWSEVPMPRGMANRGALVDIWGSRSDDVWIVSNGGDILRFDGKAFSLPVSDFTEGLRPLLSAKLRSGRWELTSIAGSSSRDIWAVGGSDFQALVLHFDGTRWTEAPFPGQGRVAAVWAAAPDDAWAAIESQNAFFHWDGARWSARSVEPGAQPRSLWGSGPSDLWAAGGSLLHWDGTAWHDLNLTTEDLYAAWFATARDGWAVGDNGTILHWDGRRWTRSPSGTTRSLASVWGTSARDVWVVGDQIVLRFDGATWHQIAAPDDRWTGVSGASANDVWIASGRALLHFDGRRVLPAGARPQGYSIALSPGRIWALGAGGLARWTGRAWVRVPGSEPDPETGPYLDAIWAIGPSVWASDRGRIVRWDSGWQYPDLPAARTDAYGLPTVDQVRSMWGASPGDIWACGGQSILHWDGRSWRRFVIPGPELMAIAGAGRDVWAVGARGTIVHWSCPDCTAPARQTP